MSYTIEPIARRHIEGFWRALDSVARERRYIAFLEAPPIVRVRRYVLDNMRAGNPHYVALHGDELVGWCDIVPKDRPTLSHTGVLGIGIVEAHRGKRLGVNLMRPTIEKAQTNGMTRIELTVRVDNPRAQRLYERVGFTVEGRISRHMKVDGEYFDSIMMSLLYDDRKGA